MNNTYSGSWKYAKLGKAFKLAQILDEAGIILAVKYQNYELNSSTVCSHLNTYHKFFMDVVDGIIKDSDYKSRLSSLYQCFLEYIIIRGLEIIEELDEMPVPAKEITSLVEQIKSRHLIALEEEEEPIVKTRYNNVIDKANEMIKPIPVVMPADPDSLLLSRILISTYKYTEIKILTMRRNDPKFAMQEFTNSDICSTIKREHTCFMDALDGIIEQDDKIEIDNEFYQLLLKNIIYRGLEILEENHAFCRMPLPEGNITSLIEQVKSRHLTELEEDPDIKTWYNKVIEKANEVIKSIPVFTPEFRAMLLQGELCIDSAKNRISLAKNIPEIVDEIIFNRLYEKIKHYKKYSPCQDYTNRPELQLIPQKLTSLKQELNVLETEFLMQEDRDALSSIITDLDILISNSHEPESKIDTRPNDGYLNFQTILQEKNQLCAI